MIAPSPANFAALPERSSSVDPAAPQWLGAPPGLKYFEWVLCSKDILHPIRIVKRAAHYGWISAAELDIQVGRI